MCHVSLHVSKGGNEVHYQLLADSIYSLKVSKFSKLTRLPEFMSHTRDEF